MGETPEPGREGTEPPHTGVGVKVSDVRDWFAREVLPLEAILMQFLRNNWSNENDIADLRQDVYVRVCEAAQKQFPDAAKKFVFATARNLLIDRIRRERIVSIEMVADLDALGIVSGDVEPDRVVMAREALRRLQVALDHLPRQCRQAVVLRKIDGLSHRQIAARMGIAEGTVNRHLSDGMRALADKLFGERSDLGRKP